MKVTGISIYSNEAIEISFDKEKIGSITPAPFNPNLPFIAPGFIDMQVNGYRGIGYSTDALHEEDIERLVDSLAESGTTQHLPTIVTSPHARLMKNLEIITDAAGTNTKIGNAVLGYHIEGPYISHEKGPRGAHDPGFIRDPDFGEYQEMQAAAKNKIRIVTLAPERKGAIEFIERIVADGVIAALGHTAASQETIEKAVEAGATFSTHLGNGSHPFIPRLKNYIWEQLASDKLHASFITDGFHLPPSVVKTFTRAKGLEKLVLVSDASLFGGCKPGLYKWGRMDVEVFKDGHIGLFNTSHLAGAGHLLDWDIPQFIRFTGANLLETIKLCTENPAGILRLGDSTGKLCVAAQANLTIFDYKAQDDRLHILKTIAGGKIMYDIHNNVG